MLRCFETLSRYLVGCTVALVSSASVDAAQAGSVKVLYAFKGGDDGVSPSSGVISDDQGNLYGTTWAGGGTGCGGNGCGTIFKVAPDGTETVLYAFKGGIYPVEPSGLVRDKEGNLYGTTRGALNATCGTPACGTVFRLSPGGTMTVLHDFGAASDDGIPAAGLLRDKKGNLYGVTFDGGAHRVGTVFKIAPDGIETVLHTFNGTDGGGPASVLVSDKAANLYGTTTYGGKHGGGTVFKLAPNGVQTVLYSFCSLQNCLDGQSPYAGVTVDKEGNLYGTTSMGGANCERIGCGTVFKLTPDGAETVLLNLDPFSDGQDPIAGVIIDHSGNLYSTVPHSFACNKRGKGTQTPVFRLAPDGGEKLYCVPNQIFGGVIERNGYLYGTGGFGYPKYASGLVFSVKK